MIARLFISPDLEVRVEEIKKILLETSLTSNHPDLLYFPYDSKLGIEQAKQVKEHFLLRPYSARGKVVVMEDASNLTLEAQNALLKTLEEPPETALLILGAPSEDKLIPTVVSRCQVVYIPVIASGAKQSLSMEEIASSTTSPRNDDFMNNIEKLLNSEVEERFEYVEKLKERGEFLHFMLIYFRNQLLNSGHLYNDRDINVSGRNVKDFLKELLQAEEWAKQNVNIRAILEYLMLVMPKLH